MATDLDHGSLLRQGGNARFVRWQNTRDGWVPEMLVGRYQGRSGSCFSVLVGDELKELPTDSWMVCKP